MLNRATKGFKWFRSRQEFRHAGMITLGSVAAQFVLLATTPILSRLFTPADFGNLSLLLVTATIGGSVAALCYDTAVLLPRSEVLSAALFRLAFFLSIVGGAVCLVVYWLFLQFSGAAPEGWALALNLALVYLGIVTTTWFNLFGTILGRSNRYRSVAFSKFNNSALPSFFQIISGLAGFQAVGLQIGRVLGQIACLVPMAANLPAGFRLSELMRPRWKRMAAVARQFRETVMHLPRVLLVRGSTSLPPVLLLMFYGPTIAGLYFLADRLVQRPGVMLSDSLTRLPMKVFAEQVREQRPIFKLAFRYTVLTTILVLPAVIILAVFGDWIFGVLFGANWIPAASFAKLQAALTAVRLGTLPAATLITALRIPHLGLGLDFVFFFRVLAIPLAAMLGYDALIAIAVYAGLTIVYHLAISYISFERAYLYDRKLSAAIAR
jgi:lipopolysaccharide exporter